MVKAGISVQFKRGLCTVKKKGVNDRVIGSIPSSHGGTVTSSGLALTTMAPPEPVDILTLYRRQATRTRLIVAESDCSSVCYPYEYAKEMAT